MSLYLLKLKDPLISSYDDIQAIVVRADSGREARRLVADSTPTAYSMGFNRKDFLDVAKTSCNKLKVDGSPEIIVADTKWG